MRANPRQFPNRLGFLVSIAFVVAAVASALAQKQIPPEGVAQIRAFLLDKANRTPAQEKLDSQIIYNSRVASGQPAAPGIPRSFTPSELERSNDGLIHVDIAADVSAGLLTAIKSLGGRIESSFAQYKTVRAWLPLSAAETLAARSEVRFIKRAERSHTNSGLQLLPGFSLREANVSAKLGDALAAAMPGPIPPVASDTTGVIAHGANIAQAAGITGSGVTIGVISNGVTSLATEQAAGRLPSVVNVLAGQSGDGPGPCPGPNCPDEGTAMLEIVYSMAPGATLYFATSGPSESQFATNIVALQAAGCNIIVDDVTFFDESVFQDGTVAAAVNTVTALGALYFSSAGNSGNLDSNASGTWEGDFNADGSAPSITETGTVHSFGPSDYDVLTGLSGEGFYMLQWSDAFGSSCNDYDLFILNPSGTAVEGASTNRQTCSQDPLETISDPKATFAVNSEIVIVNYNNSAARALHLDTERGRLSIGTSGATYSHNAAAAALTVAAVDVHTASGGLFVGGFLNPPESFSSDGPRKIFYDPSGNPITPGNFLFSTNGGTTLPKVDFTAADGVPTGVPGFNPFYGTSAAAPHAASIAALIMSANPSLTPSQVKSILYSTSLPVSGYLSRTVGTGIVMIADAPTITKAFGAATIPVNGTTSLGFVISNVNSLVPLSGIAFSDFLPSGLIVSTPNGLTGSCGGGTIVASPGSSSISLTGAALAVSGSCAFSVNVTGTSGGVKNNVTTQITTAGGAVGGVALASVTVVLPPVIAKAFGAPTVPLNQSTSLTFTITNPNATVPLSSVGFLDTLPAGLVISTPNGASGSCGAGIITAAAGSGSVMLTGGTIAAGSSCAFSVNVTGTVAGVENNVTGTVTSLNGGNGNSASASITVVAPPVISKAFAAPTILVGGSTALTFTIANPNATVALIGVGVVDTLPAGLVVSNPNGMVGNCGGGTVTAVPGAGVITLSGGSIPESTSCVFSVNVTGTKVGQQINTTNPVTSSNGGAGNTATASIIVLAPAAIEYFSKAHTTSAPDATVNIDDPGTSPGNLCADIFVFDPNQEMSECCSCTLTPDGLLTLSVNNDITGNPLTGKLLTTGAIVIIPATTQGGLCPLPTGLTSEPALRAWSTHIQTDGSGFSLTETASQPAGLSLQNLNALQSECKSIKTVGSGHGVCANSAALASICNN